MSYYILSRVDASIAGVNKVGPNFNEAAKILHANKDVKVVETQSELGGLGSLSSYVIEAKDASLDNIKKSLPGWSVKEEPQFKPL